MPLLPQQRLLKGRKRSARQISFGLGLWKCGERWAPLVPALTQSRAVAPEPELARALPGSRWWSRLPECPWAQKAVSPALGGSRLSPFSAWTATAARVGYDPAGIAPAPEEGRALSDRFGWLQGSSPPRGQGHLCQGGLHSIVSPCVLDVELEGRSESRQACSGRQHPPGAAKQRCGERRAMLLAFWLSEAAMLRS